MNDGYLFPEYGNGITSYILFKESYDALLDVEKMGVKVRDVDDEFKGAEFRDEKTKLMFAYDYDTRHCIRVNGGADIKVALYKEMKRLGVKIFDRVMATSLLTEGGEAGRQGYRSYRSAYPHRGVLYLQGQGHYTLNSCTGWDMDLFNRTGGSFNTW